MPKQNYELAGIITGKIKDRARNGTKYAGEDFWRLQVIVDHSETNEILAYENYLKDKKIWKEINQIKYHGKEYVFLVHKYFRSYWLVNWIKNGKKE